MKNICVGLSVAAFLGAVGSLVVMQPEIIQTNHDDWLGRLGLVIFILSSLFAVGVYCVARLVSEVLGNKGAKATPLIAFTGVLGFLSGLYIFIDTSGSPASYALSVVYAVIGLAMIYLSMRRSQI